MSNYIRERDLAKLIPTCRFAGKSDAQVVDIIQRYIAGSHKALARGHWSGDANRLAALKIALRGELLPHN